jgi:chaperone BCS1
MPTMNYRPSGVTLSGLLNVIDGVGSDEGRLFFATVCPSRFYCTREWADRYLQTNHYDRLDPALVRPGRIDVKLEYKKASKVQILALFNRFFSSARFEGTETPAADPSTQISDTSGLRHRRGGSDPPRVNRALSAPLSELSERFVGSVPAGEFSAAEIQGFLLDCKWDPDTAVSGVDAWVAHQREERASQRAREDERKRRQREKTLGTSAAFAGLMPGTASWAMSGVEGGADGVAPRSVHDGAHSADVVENGDSVVESDGTVSVESDFTDVGKSLSSSGA